MNKRPDIFESNVDTSNLDAAVNQGSVIFLSQGPNNKYIFLVEHDFYRVIICNNNV